MQKKFEMVTKHIKFEYKKKKINLIVEDCNLLKKFTGLMFSRREKAKTLLFNFKNPTKIRLHSIFVFFPFVVIWLDEKNKIVSLKTVKSFRFSITPNKYFSKIIEIPINNKYKKIIDFLDED
jgi:uncharacterized membrane protein (UPF0127 family)